MSGYKLTMYTYKSLDTNHQDGSALALSRQNCRHDNKSWLELKWVQWGDTTSEISVYWVLDSKQRIERSRARSKFKCYIPVISRLS